MVTDDHWCYVIFIPPSRPLSPVNAGMRHAEIQFGQQGRQGRGGERGISPKPSYSFGKQGQWLAGVHVCCIITDNESQLVPTMTHTLHACHSIKHPGRYSAPGSLPHILLSLKLFEICYTWNKRSVKWAHQSSQMPATSG